MDLGSGLNEKTISIRVSGFKDYCTTYYRRTSTRPAHREIKPQFSLVKILMLA